MAKATLYKLNLPLRSPILGLTSREVGIIKIVNDAGVGYGEVSPLPGFSKDPFAALQWGTRCAHEMINCSDNEISVKINGLITNPETAVRDAKDYEARGFSHVKIKVGFQFESWKENLVKIVEQTNLILRLDANSKLSAIQASELVSLLPKARIDYFEDPFSYETTRDLETFYKKTDISFALDNLAILEPINGLKKIITKPTLMGFIPHSENVILSSSYESALGISHIAHMVHKLHLQKEAHGLETLGVFLEPLFEVKMMGDRLRIPSLYEIKHNMNHLTETLTPVLEF